MEFKMEFLMLFLCVIPAFVASISISPNGNSPKVKMIGGMMVDVQKGFVPMTPQPVEPTTIRSNYEKSRKINVNSTKLALNERYRRLIPYMTFYYANDLANPPTDNTRNIEVEKAQIVEAKELGNHRQPKKIYYSQRNIPRYQGNRLTQYNINSANPTKIYYKDGVPIYQGPKVTSNFNPLLLDIPVYDYESGRIIQKTPSVAFSPVTKRPYLNLYNEELPNIRYYLSAKEQAPKYKLVPYDQTPPVKVSNVQAPLKIYEHTQGRPHEPLLPVKLSYNQRPLKVSYEQLSTKEPYEQNPVKNSYVQQPLKTDFEQSSVKESYLQHPVKINYESPPVNVVYEEPSVKVANEPSPVKATKESPVKVTYEQLPQNDDIYEPRKPVIVSVLVPKELYVKPRPVRPYTYDNGNSHPIRKQPAIVSESYYEKQRPQAVVSEPVIESGFKPIVSPAEYTTEAPIYTSTPSQAPVEYEAEKQAIPFIEPSPATPDTRPSYYQYVVDQPKPWKETSPSGVSLATLLNSLQVNRSIPKPITRENVASSIKTLLQVLNSLKAAQSTDGALTKPLLMSTPKPFVSTKVVKVVNDPEIVESSPEVVDPDLHEEPYLIQVNTPSQHLDEDNTLQNGQRPPSSQQFPLPVTSDEEGGTPGTPGVDYPVLSTIPQTSFDCKTQRYKGFFADTETRCQVWHYCDLNGGQASFLCPNGTIFSQAGLTCDWWFNVRCDSTTQLYVLNESLYKYILPHSPKFPEDYSGPLVDKYLTLKFKEMEEEFKKNKSKNEKSDSAEDDDDEDDDDEENDVPKTSTDMDKRQLSYLSEASVIVETPGTSGKVERLRDE